MSVFQWQLREWKDVAATVFSMRMVRQFLVLGAENCLHCRLHLWDWLILYYLLCSWCSAFRFCCCFLIGFHLLWPSKQEHGWSSVVSDKQTWEIVVMSFLLSKFIPLIRQSGQGGLCTPPIATQRAPMSFMLWLLAIHPLLDEVLMFSAVKCQ